ncbi:diflavin oxidoreductase [Alkalitalea saponilacus]|uniref:assimilatory sulfite reductase (NADPH) n=1 Tax=Alkalitalea saponilacus TaxID=889453 RepID=A0A1T5HEP5_9BACT|nr:flavodoxin domain-containing protein [Alkalitalea saponilacus]ASB48077.1 sulfite reductase subunit alpha [Alkalitalea saponilacus]SKC19165.1 NAD(P)H-dependent nitrite reductase flavoprotein subunit [Alkalitalea saponilacus]
MQTRTDKTVGEIQLKGKRNIAEKCDNSKTLYVVYGSRTGNSRAAAELAFEYGKHLGLECELLDMKDFPYNELQFIRHLLIAVSTHGEGDPPAVVEAFYHFMHSDEVPAMKGVRFSILALGDSSYNDFCKTGHDFRKRLVTLGAEEAYPIIECDIDYEENAKRWVAQSVGVFEEILPKINQRQNKEFAFELNKRELDDDNAFYARVKEKVLLTAEGYNKRTYHITLDMKGYKGEYHPGDSFGVYAINSRLLVDKILRKMNFDGTHRVLVDNKSKMLKETLVHDYEITMVTPIVVKKYAELSGHQDLIKLVENEQQLIAFCEFHDVLDMVSIFPASIDEQEFLSTLRKLNPRLYSVAASSLTHPEELHLTTGIIEYPLYNRKHSGVCSSMFSDRLAEGDTLAIFHEPNEAFRLPMDDSTPVIMVATGTGIAPFRGFLQERNWLKAKGDNWLFFGDRYSSSDFLYGKELEEYFDSGLLTRLNLAFSRDNQEKIYVQNLMEKNGKELFNWIDERNAIVYLCGNKRTMGQDVKESLKRIISTYRDIDDPTPEEYILKMIHEKRLRTDLY